MAVAGAKYHLVADRSTVLQLVRLEGILLPLVALGLEVADPLLAPLWEVHDFVGLEEGLQ